MKLTIFKCDICGNETDPDVMLHTDEHDVCVGCLEKLVNKHFAKMEEILESACAKVPLPSAHKSKGRPLAPGEPGELDAIKADRAAGMAIKEIATKYHRGVVYINKVLGRSEQAQGKSEKPKPVGKRLEVDWGKAQALRDAGWTLEAIAEEVGVGPDTVCHHTHKPEKKSAKPHEWTEAGLRRAAGTDQAEIEELMHND